jgi:ATP adenylyltransferase
MAYSYDPVTDSSRMTYFEQLKNFLTTEMRMSHVYQPVMLLEVLSRNGAASVEQIAKSLLLHDRSQIEYYESITKNMVGRVLTKNRGLTTKEGDTYSLNNYEQLTEQQVQELMSLCQNRIDGYIESRGGRIWSHRSKSSGYISGSLRYNLLKKAKYRCELCGTPADQKALEVDHIIPRNKGGSDDPSNFQILCYSCNASKRDTDDTDFRGMLDTYNNREAGCPFCELPEERIIGENELAIWFYDGYPVTKGHSLFIPKRHVSDYFDLFKPERNAIETLITEARDKLQSDDETIEGFNMGANAGMTAGQTVLHTHVHLIPRRLGDVDNPRGGVRGVIPAKQQY